MPGPSSESSRDQLRRIFSKVDGRCAGAGRGGAELRARHRAGAGINPAGGRVLFPGTPGHPPAPPRARGIDPGGGDVRKRGEPRAARPAWEWPRGQPPALPAPPWAAAHPYTPVTSTRASRSDHRPVLRSRGVLHMSRKATRHVRESRAACTRTSQAPPGSYTTHTDTSPKSHGDRDTYVSHTYVTHTGHTPRA